MCRTAGPPRAGREVVWPWASFIRSITIGITDEGGAIAGANQQVEKLDQKKQYKHLYLPSAREVTYVDVPELQFTMIDGRIGAGVLPGDSAEFRDTMGAMYGVAYALKFMSKLDDTKPLDFTVMAIEGLWATESGVFSFETEEPWVYTLLMLQPDHITQAMFAEAVEQTNTKKPNPALERMRLERWCEGPSIQLMHIGPYADEPASIAKMDAYAEAHGLELHGRHHEIYLGDPTRAKPENLKTVLRHAVHATADSV